MEHSGNVGGVYDGNEEHLINCIKDIKNKTSKKVKVVDRSYSNKFSYQAILSGIYVSNGESILNYKMPSSKELNEKNYQWGRSAGIL